MFSAANTRTDVAFETESSRMKYQLGLLRNTEPKERVRIDPIHRHHGIRTIKCVAYRLRAEEACRR